MINQVIVGDITNAPSDNLILHQTNCRGTLGAGLAKSLCNTFPDLKNQYLKYCFSKSPEQLLGTVYIAECVNKHTGISSSIANVFGQLNYGRDPNVIYTDYHALEKAFNTLSGYDGSMCMPYGFGAGLANGDWKTIVGLINKCLPNNNITLYKYQDKPIHIGFTERCDPSTSLDWVRNLSADGNVVISKKLTDDLISVLLNDKDKIIFHHTVTGFGGKKIEPNVPTKEWSKSQFDKLIGYGFPIAQTVLRVDPIIPTDKGTETAISVMELYTDTGVRRVRFSFMDMYPHVKERFQAHGVPLPYESFNAPNGMMLSAINKLSSAAKSLGYQLECCAEAVAYKKGCLSKTDYDILNIPYESTSKSNQRSNCLCCGSKYELIKSTSKCPFGCLYCYWKA